VAWGWRFGKYSGRDGVKVDGVDGMGEMDVASVEYGGAQRKKLKIKRHTAVFGCRDDVHF